jgi:hypothetical protein
MASLSKFSNDFRPVIQTQAFIGFSSMDASNGIMSLITRILQEDRMGRNPRASASVGYGRDRPASLGASTGRPHTR